MAFRELKRAYARGHTFKKLAKIRLMVNYNHNCHND
jgi:hypothetical protein